MSSKAASFAGEREESDVSVQYTPPIHLLDHQHLSKSESDIFPLARSQRHENAWHISWHISWLRNWV